MSAVELRESGGVGMLKHHAAGLGHSPLAVSSTCRGNAQTIYAPGEVLAGRSCRLRSSLLGSNPPLRFLIAIH